MKMFNVKTLSIEELRNLSSVIEKELDYRRQEDVNQAINDFQRAFNHLQELRVDVQYCHNSWDGDTVYLREWDGFSFY